VKNLIEEISIIHQHFFYLLVCGKLILCLQ